MSFTSSSSNGQANGKKARLEARISQEQKELVLEAARITGCSLTDFVVNTVVEAAKQTLQQQQIVELSEKDRLFFVENLLNPSPPSEKLQASAQRYRQQSKKIDAISR